MERIKKDFNQYVRFLMNKYGMSENNAEDQADSDFGLLEDDNLREPVIDLLELWEEAEDRITEKLAIEGVNV